MSNICAGSWHMTAAAKPALHLVGSAVGSRESTAEAVSAIKRSSGTSSCRANARAAASTSRAVVSVGALPYMTMASCVASARKVSSLPSTSWACAVNGAARSRSRAGMTWSIDEPGRAAHGAERSQAVLNLARMAGAYVGYHA